MGIRISNVTDDEVSLETGEYVDVEVDVIRKNKRGKPVEIVITGIYD